MSTTTNQCGALDTGDGASVVHGEASGVDGTCDAATINHCGAAFGVVSDGPVDQDGASRGDGDGQIEQGGARGAGDDAPIVGIATNSHGGGSGGGNDATSVDTATTCAIIFVAATLDGPTINQGGARGGDDETAGEAIINQGDGALGSDKKCDAATTSHRAAVVGAMKASVDKASVGTATSSGTSSSGAAEIRAAISRSDSGAETVCSTINRRRVVDMSGGDGDGTTLIFPAEVGAAFGSLGIASSKATIKQMKEGT